MFLSLSSIFPANTGVIHFIGIGGIGMSGIAEILNSIGYKIQGSDIAENYVIDRLRTLGIKVFKGHDASNITDAALVVRSTDVQDDNIEVVQAVANGIPVIKRSEMLAEIMRFKHSISISGTHGKTTTTSLVANLLEKAMLDPTVINGGIINKKGTNAYVGQGNYLVAEADESDGTFIKIPSYVGVITNIDPEHLNYYQTFENAIAAYRRFITNLPFYGFGVLCYDHPIVHELGKSIKERKIISYGLQYKNVDFKATNIRLSETGSIFDVEISESYVRKKKLPFSTIQNIELGMHGNHNVSNCLSAIVIGMEIGIQPSIIQSAFSDVGGVKRRFTVTGVIDNITIIDDYAHHPVEIEATLATARNIADSKSSSVIAVMQPHRYSRLKDLMEEFSMCFEKADHVIISEVHSAGEQEIKGVSADILIEKAKMHHSSVHKLTSVENLANTINKLAKKGDYVVLLGAGSITKWAYDLPNQLETVRKKVA